MKPKRENIRGKYYIVLRTDSGKILQKVKWSPTKQNLKTVSKSFKENNSLDDKVKIRRLTNVYETLDGRLEQVKYPVYGSLFQISVRVGDEWVHSRSGRIFSKSQIPQARKEAEENLSVVLGAMMHPQDYNESKAKAKAKAMDTLSVIERHESIVNYSDA